MASATIVAVLALYLIVLLIIGVWGSRGSQSLAGYYVAGKKLPAWVIAFSSNSTGESAWLLLGLTGMGYAVGIHALWIVLGEVLGVTLGWVLVALPFKEYTDRYDSITIPDYLESRFRDSAHVMRILSFLIIFSMVTAYTAAQLTASGKAFGSFLGTSYTTGVLTGAAVILYYTSVGGFKAVAYSDLLQGVLMFGGLLVLPIVGIVAVGGWSNMVSQLQSVDPSLLLPMGEYGVSLEGVMSAASFVGIGLAFLGAPQLLTRFMAAKGRNEIVNGSLIAVICIIIFDSGAVFAGMAGRALFPDLADSETILPVMSTELFPAVFTGLFLVIVLAAIMSTVDSLLILASSAVVRDVVQQIFHPALSERRLSLYGKLVTALIGVTALVFALRESRMIFWFVLFAWSGLASAFAPVVLCSLFWKRTSRAGAVAGMLSGFLTAMLWVLWFKAGFYSLYEMLPGFLVGFVVTVGVSLLTEAPEGAAEEHESVWRAVGHPFRRSVSRADRGGPI
ncbi:MAG: sodium/proline symporter [Acidobacteriota bacterium]